MRAGYVIRGALIIAVKVALERDIVRSEAQFVTFPSSFERV
jgi:hypothetical protein